MSGECDASFLNVVSEMLSSCWDNKSTRLYN